MKPTAVVSILGIVLICANIQYYWLEDSIQYQASAPILFKNDFNSTELSEMTQQQKESLYERYYEEGDALVDWCEYNYIWSKYIAEFYNSITSIIYIIGAVFNIIQYPQYFDFIFLNIIGIFIGITSFAFHSTLYYDMQILDELSMYCLVSYASVILMTRNNDRNKFYLNIFATINVLFCFYSLMFTERDSFIHSIGRIQFSMGFGILFLFILYSASKLSIECNNENIQKYFDRSFIIFVAALICWLFDNFGCDLLRNNKYKIPYLQLHAFGWHIGTALGLYYMSLVIISQRFLSKYKQIKFNQNCFDIFPTVYYFAVDQKKDA